MCIIYECCRSCKRSTSHRIDCPHKGTAAGVVFIVTVSDNSWKGVPDFQLLLELLDALADPAHFFLIHLDLNSSPDFIERIIHIAMQQPHANLVQHPFPCSWEGMHPLPATGPTALPRAPAVFWPICYLQAFKH